MRPRGEISLALIQAVGELETPAKGPTLRELAAYARIGIAAASYTLQNLVRAGRVCIRRTRKVNYRNRPVAEYAAVVATVTEPETNLQAVFSAWLANPH